MNTDSSTASEKNTSDDPIEKKKNEFDLRPALEFVERHFKRYEAAYSLLTFRPLTSAVLNVKFLSEDLLDSAGPQINQLNATEIISRLPKSVLELSMLEHIDYAYARTVPIPLFNEHGVWDSGRVDMVELSKFPRSSDHPSRILIGYSTGKVIFPSALPKSVFGGNRARWFFQLHVFLHEFFHTIEFLRRDEEIRDTIKLARGNIHLSFQEWWLKWEEAFLSPHKLQFPTRYAGNYRHSLTLEVKKSSPGMFKKALAELICESFAGYILGIAPNDENNPVFSSHSPIAWNLMDYFVNAKVVTK